MQLIIDLAIKYWTNFVFGIFAALLGLVYRRVLTIKKEAEEQRKKEDARAKAMQDAMVALMRDRIFQACRYHLKNGQITTNDLEVLNALYESYHELGGDTIATELVKRVGKLKIVIEDIH